MTKEEFDKLTENEKRLTATEALIWFCVTCELNPFLSIANRDPKIKNNVEVIKILIGKYKDGEIKEIISIDKEE